MAKTAAEKKAAAAVEEMDSMFGVDVIPMGDTSIRVRRVLSRNQQRQVGDVIAAVQAANLELNRLLANSGDDPEPDEDGNTPVPLTEDELKAAAENLEEQMHSDLMRGIDAYVVDASGLHLSEWGTPSLSQLFRTLQRHGHKALENAVEAHFPTNGRGA